MNYRYGMKHRPFGIGCQPKMGVVEVVGRDEMTLSEDCVYYNIVVYDRELTNDQVARFELTPLEDE